MKEVISNKIKQVEHKMKLILLLTLVAFSQAVVRLPVGDTTVLEPDNGCPNYCTSTFFRVARQVSFAGLQTGRGFLEYSLSGLSGTLTNAYLVFTQGGGPLYGGSKTFVVNTTGNFNECTLSRVTCPNPPPVDTGIVSTGVSISFSDATVNIPATSACQLALNNGASSIKFHAFVPTGTNTYLSFHSKENPSGNGPKLVLEGCTGC